MSAFDSSFRKIAGETKILTPEPACRAVVVRAGPADHRHDEVADFNARDVRADFDDFPQRLMADDQVGGPGRRCAVFEGADLFVRAANAGFEHAQLDVGGGAKARFGYIDQTHLFRFRCDCDSSHDYFSWATLQRYDNTTESELQW